MIFAEIMYVYQMRLFNLAMAFKTTQTEWEHEIDDTHMLIALKTE